MHTHTDARARAHTHTHTDARARTHTHTHTHTCSVARQMVERDGKLFCFDEFNVTDVGDAVILRSLMDTLWDMGSVFDPPL